MPNGDPMTGGKPAIIALVAILALLAVPQVLPPPRPAPAGTPPAAAGPAAPAPAASPAAPAAAPPAVPAILGPDGPSDPQVVVEFACARRGRVVTVRGRATNRTGRLLSGLSLDLVLVDGELAQVVQAAPVTPADLADGATGRFGPARLTLPAGKGYSDCLVSAAHDGGPDAIPINLVEAPQPEAGAPARPEGAPAAKASPKPAGAKPAASSTKREEPGALPYGLDVLFVCQPTDGFLVVAGEATNVDLGVVHAPSVTVVFSAADGRRERRDVALHPPGQAASKATAFDNGERLVFGPVPLRPLTPTEAASGQRRGECDVIRETDAGRSHGVQARESWGSPSN